VSDRDDVPHRVKLREVAKQQRRQERAKAEQAFRERQLEVALLQTCLCLYPLEALHAEWCPAEAMRISALEARRRREVSPD
jgi:hypothetical protein